MHDAKYANPGNNVEICLIPRSKS